MNTLRSNWQGLTANAAPSTAANAWQELEACYSEPVRGYHNTSHLEELFGWAERLDSHLESRASVHWAIFYHDIIYVPGNADTEERSAALAEQRLPELGVGAEATRHVAAWIRASKSHVLEAPFDTNDARLFLDMDLAVLGSDAQRYERYTAQIRQEFKRFPDLLYKPGRRKVLKHFLAKDRIYATDHMHQLLDAAARRNLSNELASL